MNNLITQSEAQIIAGIKVNRYAEIIGVELSIISEETKSVESGWVFFYQSQEYLKTKNPSSQLAGNSPIFITKNGLLYELPTSISYEEALKNISIYLNELN